MYRGGKLMEIKCTEIFLAKLSKKTSKIYET